MPNEIELLDLLLKNRGIKKEDRVKMTIFTAEDKRVFQPATQMELFNS